MLIPSGMGLKGKESVPEHLRAHSAARKISLPRADRAPGEAVLEKRLKDAAPRTRQQRGCWDGYGRTRL